MTGILISVCLVLQGATGPTADTLADHLKRAAAFEQEHEYEKAIPELRLALKLRPDSVEAHGLLGEALLTQGYSAEAIPHLERAKRLDLLGIALTEEHDTAQAIETLRAALQKKPNDPDLLFYLGKACGFLSKSSFDRLISVNPNSPRAHQLMGEGYQAQQKYSEAEREYRKALEIRPDLRGMHLALGLIKLEAGNLSAAETEFRAEVKISPGDGEAAWRLGSVLLKEGYTQEALAELQRSDKLRPQMIETLYDLGKAYDLDNQPRAAEKAWLEVIALDDSSPATVSAHLELSKLYRKQGKLAEANRHLKKFQEMAKEKQGRY
jgi:tetratricopeptide (TPR) repeat protein